MELALSLGDTPKPFSLLEKSQKILGKDLGFCMGMAVGKSDAESNTRCKETTAGLLFSADDDQRRSDSSSDPPVQLDLLPFSPVHRTHPSSHKFPFPWLTEKLGGDGVEGNMRRGGDEGHDQEGASLSSPNSAVSSFQMDFCHVLRSGKRDFEQITTAGPEGADRGTSSRGSDEEENGMLARKKLRLSKEQSAFLEESFKEHNTLNPKQKLALAKQLNFVLAKWKSGSRTEELEENRRLQKELQELRALKASQPFYMQLPATTLTMCPSCERVATTTTTSSATPAAVNNPSKLFSLSPPHQAASN
ncbi:UNVERIFIED_CONTAM: Homeobox-leucine zipper protein HAT14 [Sesamum calycinum]|uniref:Homeobox-leucine zipper protein HAT14 n=1 Tax=Sesamum calycinum TaxID=2727403 RepID=A0AAW2RWF0_9LAMI